MTRKDWERIHVRNVGEDCAWYAEDLPDQVVDLVQGPDLAKGRALDLGCGAGNLTIQLARYFTVVVGIDFTESAIRRAFTEAAGGNEMAHFVVGDATALPFPNGQFDFVLDRGCLLTIPEEKWPNYFADIERVMKEGAWYQVFFRNQDWTGRQYRHAPQDGRRRPSILERIHYRLRRQKRKSMKVRADPLDNLPAALVRCSVETVPFLSGTEAQVEYTHIICRKTGADGDRFTES